MAARYTIKGILAGVRRRVMRPFLARRARARHRRTVSELAAGRITADRLLFVCYGNICRSPFAEKVASSQSPQRLVESAGFHQAVGRPSPANMQFAAHQLGIDLADWRSSLVTSERIEGADLVILFDLHNFALYEREFGQTRAHVVMLGLLADSPDLEISDPYGRGNDEAVRVGRQIQESVARLLALSERGMGPISSTRSHSKE